MMLFPTVTDGVAVFETETSAELTMVEIVDTSFSELGSAVALTIVAMFVNVVPDDSASVMCPTSVKVTEPPAASDAIVQVIVPFAPTAGVEHMNVGPEFWTNDTKVIAPGRASVRLTLTPGFGPPLTTVML